MAAYILVRGGRFAGRRCFSGMILRAACHAEVDYWAIPASALYSGSDWTGTLTIVLGTYDLFRCAMCLCRILAVRWTFDRVAGRKLAADLGVRPLMPSDLVTLPIIAAGGYFRGLPGLHPVTGIDLVIASVYHGPPVRDTLPIKQRCAS